MPGKILEFESLLPLSKDNCNHVTTKKYLIVSLGSYYINTTQNENQITRQTKTVVGERFANGACNGDTTDYNGEIFKNIILDITTTLEVSHAVATFLPQTKELAIPNKIRFPNHWE